MKTNNRLAVVLVILIVLVLIGASIYTDFQERWGKASYIPYELEQY